MENLVCDFKNALVNVELKNLNSFKLNKIKKKHKKSKQRKENHKSSRHQHHHNHFKRRITKKKLKNETSFPFSNLSRLNKSNEKHKKLMKVIIAAAAASSTSSTTGASMNLLNHNNQKEEISGNIDAQLNTECKSLNNLVRFKQRSLSRTKNSSKVSGRCCCNRKKKKKLYKIQKTYRFRNYRLRCIRLRQFQQKQRRNNRQNTTFTRDDYGFSINEHKRPIGLLNTKILSLSHIKMESNFDSSSSNNSQNSSSSSSSSRCSSRSTSGNETKEYSSLFSSSDNESLVECFNATKFLNSSDSKDDEKHEQNNDSDLSFGILKQDCFKSLKLNTSLKIKKQSKKFKKKHKSNQKNLQKKSYKISIGNGTSVNSMKKNSKANFSNLTSINDRLKSKSSNDLNFECSTVEAKTKAINEAFKRKRQIDIEFNENNEDELTNSNYESDYKEFKKQNSNSNDKNKLLRFSGSNDSPPSRNLQNSRLDKPRLFLSEKINSNNENDFQSSDDREADDEQSDFPINEKTAIPLEQKKLNSKKSTSSILSNSVTHSILSLSSKSLNEKKNEVIPWWENLNLENLELQASTSNYQKSCMQNFDANKSEFDTILNGAFNLMTNTSKNNYKKKVSNQMRSRYGEIGKVNYELRTKNQLNCKFKQIHDFQNIEGQPIPETNIGNRILQKLGWKPGSCLGLKTDKSNLITPIIAVKRPNKLGLGFDATNTTK